MLLDFDGTLVSENVSIVLVGAFAPDGQRIAKEIDEALAAHKMTLREAWQKEVALLPAPRAAEMVQYAIDNVHLRPGARELFALLRERKIPTSVVSGGLDFYIHPLLRHHGIDVPVFADAVEVVPGTQEFRLLHPHGHATCRLCGICKAQVVRGEAGPGRATIYAGDGSTDRFAAEVADVVFARHRLKDYCTREGIPFLPFEEFTPVTEKLRSWSGGQEPLPSGKPLGRSSSPCPISQELAGGTSPAA